ncbi:ATPase [Aureimonas sp. SA4125]|uniref:ATP-binding protein n=1 Tax=Aureimonas sp. SA4125 TaxID=2826993 RepID=UPI001CC7931C|nr:ATP-binding protein [Aureimonas sp. SA4125]BDA84737.1 ATPase [Aureimonas sp. SA4125]
MNAPDRPTRSELNQRDLAAQLGRIEALLQRALERAEGASAADVPDVPDVAPDPAGMVARLAAIFRLSDFERDILLLCAAPELSSRAGELCARLHGDPQRRFPTLAMALAVLPHPHWSALAPHEPLRRWHLVVLVRDGSLTDAPLALDERILHALAGVGGIDERLSHLLERVAASGRLSPSHATVAERIGALWAPTLEHIPMIELIGPDAEAKFAIAATAGQSLGLSTFRMRAEDIPATSAERTTIARIVGRELALAEAVLVLDSGAARDRSDRVIAHFAASIPGPVILALEEPLSDATPRRIRLDVAAMSEEENRAAWFDALGPGHPEVDRLAASFRLDGAQIAAAVANAEVGSTGDVGTRLWNACRLGARRRLDDLAQRIDARATWDDLVLPAPQVATLRQVAMHVRHSGTVYRHWGFAEKANRGLGIAALFAGPSGTGKTMAAEVLANEIALDLYRIDLSQVVSKYIGETEKNLRRIFDAAETGGAILLFDEADALFGKRSEVKDSHDRYANIEVSYLLQRMEAYRGLAILTTNLKTAIDQAFMRRIRFLVHFPFPEAAQRAEIWRRIFPQETPTAGLDHARLGQLTITGGNIRNVALNAAFLAADRGAPVSMDDIRRSALAEYAKIEKPMTSTELGGWS